MKIISLFLQIHALSLCLFISGINAEAAVRADSLPYVLPADRSDLLDSRLRYEGAVKFAFHQLPATPGEWQVIRSNLKDEIIRKTAVVFNHDLPVDLRETGRIEMDGYSIRKIYFQTRPGVYATASLYVPVGKGPFPAVINMLGHWRKAKIDTAGPQAVGHSLAVNGYVCLTIDPWGSGERTTVHGIFEDHGDGNNLGSSLINIGEPQMGIELSDNIRGVDLLVSLPFVDKTRIGATGASGGGNQTMWLAAMDERVKAAMPVVSVGTFCSYIMGSPCICEVVIDALTFTEESGILALVAPRAIKMCNHLRDDNPAFFPSEMIRSYENAKPVFKMMGAEKNISYQIFDLEHGYMAQDREAMLGWFDLHLKGKGDGSARKELPFQQVPGEKLMVFQPGTRDQLVKTTGDYCQSKGNEMRQANLGLKSIDADIKKSELASILHISEKPEIRKVQRFSSVASWERCAIETSDNKIIPVLIRKPAGKSGEFIIVVNPLGKEVIQLNQLDVSGKGIAIVDLSGTGEASFLNKRYGYEGGKLRVLARSQMWLGKTVLGEWVKELGIVEDYLTTAYKAKNFCIDGTREAGLAALFFRATGGNAGKIIMRESPVSFIFDDRDNVDFFSNAVFLQGIIRWGDVSMATGLAGTDVEFIDPLTISGHRLNPEKLKEIEDEYSKMKSLFSQTGKTIFGFSPNPATGAGSLTK